MASWTPDTIKALLDRSDKAVEHAVVAIYRRQTSDEQVTGETRHHNRRGFASCHAHLGTYYAKWILSGHRLTGGHLVRARHMVQCYSKQLLQVAQARQERELIYV